MKRLQKFLAFFMENLWAVFRVHIGQMAWFDKFLRPGQAFGPAKYSQGCYLFLAQPPQTTGLPHILPSNDRCLKRHNALFEGHVMLSAPLFTLCLIKNIKDEVLKISKPFIILYCHETRLAGIFMRVASENSHFSCL